MKVENIEALVSAFQAASEDERIAAKLVFDARAKSRKKVRTKKRKPRSDAGKPRGPRKKALGSSPLGKPAV